MSLKINEIRKRKKEFICKSYYQKRVIKRHLKINDKTALAGSKIEFHFFRLNVISSFFTLAVLVNNPAVIHRPEPSDSAEWSKKLL